MEVITPVLSRGCNTDPAIQSLSLETDGARRFLHTSPEFAMKRLLVAGSGDIYQICRVFRANESGTRHSPEFTMLEWYRVGIDHQRLISEVDALLQNLWSSSPRATSGESLCSTAKVSYVDRMGSVCGLPFEQITSRDVLSVLETHSVDVPQSMLVGLEVDDRVVDREGAVTEDRTNLDAWLDLLFTTVIVPQFDRHRFTCVVDYPASQAALARTAENPAGVKVAERFEFFFGELELANGYHELQSAPEHRARISADMRERRRLGSETPPLDQAFLAAIDHGLPACAGVAMGLERLFMVLSGEQDMQRVMSFGFERA